MIPVDTHTDTYFNFDDVEPFFLMPLFFSLFSLQILRRADKNGKCYTASSIQSLT